MAAVDVVPPADQGLGNSACLVDLGDGRAPAVDAGRDLRALRAAAGRLGLKVAYAADTHLHADFLTGARQPAAGDSRVLDIRQDNEYAAGHLPGAGHIELGALTARADGLPTGPMVVMCGHSERAMGAVSLLKRAGRDDVKALDGGPQDWADVTGDTLETSK